MPGPKLRWWIALLMLLASISSGNSVVCCFRSLLGALVQSLLTSPQVNASMVPLVLLLAFSGGSTYRCLGLFGEVFDV